MKNKYLMSIPQNRQLVRDHLNDFVFYSMILARYDVKKENVYDPRTLQSDSEEKVALDNFFNAYEYLLTKNDVEAGYDVLMELHAILMHDLEEESTNELDEEQIRQLNEMINQPAKANTEIALDAMLFILRGRLFADGDVRVAIAFANKILLDRGNGFIAIHPDKAHGFRQLLKAYNNDENKAEEFKTWIFKYGIKGRRFDQFN